MDELIDKMAVLDIKNRILCHDMNVLINCYYAELPQLNVMYLKIKPHLYESPQSLYEDILRIDCITQQNLLDIMPYIDDYLNYYDHITSS